MNKRLVNSALSLLILLAVALCITPAAMATVITAGDWLTLIDHNNLDSAGIMTYAVSDTNGGTAKGTYDTFCIQDNVYIWYGESFLVKDISSTVGQFDTSVPAPVGEGPLAGGVDYLFYQFTIGAYDAELYNTGTTLEKKQKQADLQKTFWNLQGSAPSMFTVSDATPWANDLSEYMATDSLHNKSWGTQVLNIVKVDAKGNVVKIVQNQLYNQVPEPATMLLLGFGLVGVAGMRRKLSN